MVKKSVVKNVGAGILMFEYYGPRILDLAMHPPRVKTPGVKSSGRQALRAIDFASRDAVTLGLNSRGSEPLRVKPSRPPILACAMNSPGAKTLGI